MALVGVENALGHLERPVVPVAGRFLSTIARRAKVDPRARAVIGYVDGKPCFQRDWKKKRVKPTSVVTFQLLPRKMGGGGGGGPSKGKMIGAAIAGILLAVTAPWVGALFFAAGSIGAGVVSALYIAGGSFLINKFLAPQAQRKAEETTERSPYGLSGGGNLPRPFDHVPCIYGRVWHSPDLSQNDYMEYNGGETKTLYKRMTIGVGKYQLNQVKVGNTILWDNITGFNVTSFPGVNIELIQPGTVSNLVPFNTITIPDVSGIELPVNGSGVGPFTVTGPGVEVTRLTWDLSLPRGAAWRDDKGTLHELSASYILEYRRIHLTTGAPLEDWQVAFGESFDLKSFKPFQFSKSLAVAKARYEVQARRYGLPPPEKAEGSGIILWDQFRAGLPDPAIRPDVTEFALQVTTSAELFNTSFSNVKVNVTRILDVWDGTGWNEVVTRSPSHAAVDALVNTVYGGKLPASRVDLARFLSYATVYAARGDTFDCIIRGPTSVLEAVETILRAGRSQPINTGRRWTMIRDEPKVLPPKLVFTGNQIVAGSCHIEYDPAPLEGVGDVILDFFLDGDPDQAREVRHTIGDPIATPKHVSIDGITEWDQAFRECAAFAAADMYRRKRVTFQVELDGRLVRRGDACTVDVPFVTNVKIRQVRDLDSFTLYLTDPIEISTDDHVVFRDTYGREWGAIAVTQGDDEYHVELNSEDVVTLEGLTGRNIEDVINDGVRGGDFTTARIGKLTYLTDEYVVVGARPTDENYAEVTVIYDNAAVHAADGSPVPTPPIIPDRGVIPTVLAIAFIFGEMRQNGNVMELNWAVPPVMGAVRYIADISYDVGTTWGNISDGASPSGTAVVRPNDLVLRVRAFSGNGNSAELTKVITAPTTFKFYADDLAQGAVSAAVFERGIARLLLPSFRRGGLDDSRISALFERALDATEQKTRMRATSGLLSASVEHIRRVMVDETTALATDILALSSELHDPVTGLNAVATALTSLTTLVTTIDGDLTATAALVTQIDAAVDEVSASGRAGFLVVATAAGALASYRLQVKTAVGGSYVQAGLRLDALSGGTSSMTVDATTINMISSSFRLYDAGVSGGAMIQIFSASGGFFVFNGNIRINGSLAVTGTFTSAAIATASRSQRIAYAFGSISGITTLSTFITARGTAIEHFFWLNVSDSGLLSAGKTKLYNLERNGVNIVTFNPPLNVLSAAGPTGSATANYGGIITQSYLDQTVTPGVGYTYIITTSSSFSDGGGHVADVVI